MNNSRWIESSLFLFLLSMGACRDRDLRQPILPSQTLQEGTGAAQQMAVSAAAAEKPAIAPGGNPPAPLTTEWNAEKKVAPKALTAIDVHASPERIEFFLEDARARPGESFASNFARILAGLVARSNLMSREDFEEYAKSIWKSAHLQEFRATSQKGPEFLVLLALFRVLSARVDLTKPEAESHSFPYQLKSAAELAISRLNSRGPEAEVRGYFLAAEYLQSKDQRKRHEILKSLLLELDTTHGSLDPEQNAIGIALTISAWMASGRQQKVDAAQQIQSLVTLVAKSRNRVIQNMAYLASAASAAILKQEWSAGRVWTDLGVDDFSAQGLNRGILLFLYQDLIATLRPLASLSFAGDDAKWLDLRNSYRFLRDNQHRIWIEAHLDPKFLIVYGKLAIADRSLLVAKSRGIGDSAVVADAAKAPADCSTPLNLAAEVPSNAGIGEAFAE